MIVIVGHGPSILSGLGAVIDSHTVIRLKQGHTPKKLAQHFGTRTDYIVGRSPSYAKASVPFWHFGGELERKWVEYFRAFEPAIPFKPFVPKPSHGLCAAFCAVEYLKPKELAFIGCDRLLEPHGQTWKWNGGEQCFPHDWHAENRALHSLGVNIIDLRHGQVHRKEP